jgi:hypothetical protein
MSIYTDQLKRMNSTAQQQMKDYTPGGFAILPEGEYQCRVEAKLGITKNPDRLTVFWTYTVTEGDRTGKKAIERNILEGGSDDGKTAKQICRGHIEDLGFEWPERMEGVEEILDQINTQPPLVTIQVTHSTSEGKGKNEGKTFTNANVRLIDVLESSGNLGNSENKPEETEDSDGSDDSDEADRQALLNLCGSYGSVLGCEIDDSMTTVEMLATLHEAGSLFKRKDLNKETGELDLIERLDSSLIEEDAPPPLTRTMAKKPTAASPAKGKAAPTKGRK